MPRGKKSPMPTRIAPMLCTLTREPINDPEYLFEIKWDGYRIISYVNKGKVRMDSRSALNYTSKYPPVAEALQKLKHAVVLDGEVVVFNQEGHPDFDALQTFNGHSTPISYCVFDILWLDGYNLTELPLTERKDILKNLLKGGKAKTNGVLRFSESFEDGPALYKQMLNLNLEGIVAKRKESVYAENERGNNWLKTPTRKRQEFVIGGWAESDKSRSFRSLLFGAYNKNKFEWIGRSGGGYKEKDMPGILQQLKKLEIKESPFDNKVLDTKGAAMHWVKPQLVANFEFAAWTKTGRIRKPATFLGFRKDKKPKDVVREVPKNVDIIEEQENDLVEMTSGDAKPKNLAHKSSIVKKKANAAKKLSTSEGSNWKVLEKSSPEHVDEITIGKCEVQLSDVERNVWKDVPKAKLIGYYHSVAKYILPHLKDRPQSLYVKPNGAGGPGFYVKDMEGRQPACAEVFADRRRHPKPGKRDTIDYLVCNNEATLLYMVNLGCIDINPWMSRTMHPTQPDFFNIDLDPSDNNFGKVIDVALAAKEVLHKIKLQSFIKTSGKTGMHIYIPVTGISFEQARSYSEQVGAQIHERVKNISTLNVSVSSRKNKVFIDPSQNDYADTLASAYSVRPNHLPTVSTPLDWKEIKPGLDSTAFTIDTIVTRLAKKGDLFKPVLDKKIATTNTKQLEKL